MTQAFGLVTVSVCPFLRGPDSIPEHDSLRTSVPSSQLSLEKKKEKKKVLYFKAYRILAWLDKATGNTSSLFETIIVQKLIYGNSFL